MTVTCARTGRELTTKYAMTAFGAERETVEVAFPGDVVGLVNATGLQLGDTVHEAGAAVTYPPIPRFSPEVFATARPLDTGRAKQFRKGLEQLDEEGVVQVLRDLDHAESAPILAAVGALQFDVFSHRLAGEFGAPAEILPAGYQAIRRTDTESLARLRDIGGIRVLRRSDGAIVALFENRYRLARLEQDEPELTLEPLVAGAVPVVLTAPRSARPAHRSAPAPYPEPMLRTLTRRRSRPARRRSSSRPLRAFPAADRPPTAPAGQPRLGPVRGGHQPRRSSARRWPCRSTTPIRPDRRSTSP